MYEFFSQISNFLSAPFINMSYGVKGIPLLSAFILGIIGALAPCQFTGNLGAITIYGNKSLQKEIVWKEVSLFIFGKIFVFSSLGFVVWLLGKEFQQSLIIFFPWIRKAIGPLLILIGLYLVGLFKMNWTVNFGKIPDKFINGKLGAFFMGVSFSLGFCPTMFVLFFISLMPIVLSTPFGAVLPTIFAIGTSLPLIIAVSLIWYFGIDGKSMKKRGRKFGKSVQFIAGIIMLLLGILDTLTYWTF
ncbi:sulfite exporter TauE/SafE family protein [Bacillus solimangrovi]|uniref:Cytochrome C biosynthesis protein n=1 Tax=Bacillus solimangrovi TaxID=1305675 RepID=A0A1E5LE62_9BACI|nr:sulfite exporter TauE/SafE family protein [Bacillus solimangrovi]OEH92360.1 cytochrome C biosynthesis protein [Bacillus solimangrovi]